MRRFLNRLWNWFLWPFAILHVRWIQYRYKRISTTHKGNRRDRHIDTLILLQAKEDYYKEAFDSWGKFHPRFAYTHKQHNRHLRFLLWLFPDKDFEEWEIVVWHKYEAVTFYHNLLYRHSKDPYDAEAILKQIREWKVKRHKTYGIDLEKH